MVVVEPRNEILGLVLNYKIDSHIAVGFYQCFGLILSTDISTKSPENPADELETTHCDLMICHLDEQNEGN